MPLFRIHCEAQHELIVERTHLTLTCLLGIYNIPFEGIHRESTSHYVSSPSPQGIAFLRFDLNFKYESGSSVAIFMHLPRRSLESLTIELCNVQVILTAISESWKTVEKTRKRNNRNIIPSLKVIGKFWRTEDACKMVDVQFKCLAFAKHSCSRYTCCFESLDYLSIEIWSIRSSINLNSKTLDYSST